MAPPGDDPGTEGLEGVLSRVDVQEGPPVVVNALLETDSGHTVSLYMRGQESKGIIRPRDRVRVDGPTRRDADGTLLVSDLCNLTTENSTFKVWSPSLRSRLADASGKALISAVIGPAVGALVGALVAAVLSGKSASAARSSTGELPFTDGNPTPTGTSHVAIAIIVAAVIAVIVAVAIFYRLHVVPRRRERAALLTAATASAEGLP